jgi:hypothetical protein
MALSSNEVDLESLLPDVWIVAHPEHFLEARRPYLPDYEARHRAGLWIASNRVEKFHDWSVSVRWKHRGMEWTAAGVVALASLEAARRNGELPQWRAQRSLPAWEAPPADGIAA